MRVFIISGYKYIELDLIETIVVGNWGIIVGFGKFENIWMEYIIVL